MGGWCKRGDVVDLNVVTTLDIPVEKVLKRASEKGLTSVFTVGYGEEGGEYFASSLSDGPTALWLLERARSCLLQMSEEED